MNLSLLAKPFRADEIEYRLARCGEKKGYVWAICLAYIQARAIQERLDAVCGPENWRVSYEFIGAKGVVCNLSIKCGDEWVTKQDGAEMSDIEPFKGGISGALKRAGSAWGIGRYLYYVETQFAIISETKTPYDGKTKNGIEFYWLPPPLPAWALPKAEPLPDQDIPPNNKPSSPPAAPKADPVALPKTVPPVAAPEKKLAIAKPIVPKQVASVGKLNYFFMKASHYGWKEPHWKAAILKKWNYTSTKEMTTSEVDTLVEHMEKHPKTQEPATSEGHAFGFGAESGH